VVGWVDLRADDVGSQLKDFASNPKLLAVRHIAQGGPDDRFPLQSEFLRGIGMLAQFGLTYDILIHARQLPVAAELVSRDQRFVPFGESADKEPKPSTLGETGVFRISSANYRDS
jgi:L-fuconolactonase